MFNLLKRKKAIEVKPVSTEKDYFFSYTLATVSLTTETDFKAFCDYGYNNRMVIDYAISNMEHWKTIEPMTGCYAVINYVPNAGMGRYIRVLFWTWNPLNQPRIAEIMEKAKFNYENVAEFEKNYAPDMIYWLLTSGNSITQ
jgi:hypothetical protein